MKPRVERDPYSGAEVVICRSCGGQCEPRVGFDFGSAGTWLWWACVEDSRHVSVAVPIPDVLTDLAATLATVTSDGRSGLQRPGAPRATPRR